jgi:hypothetical protein
MTKIYFDSPGADTGTNKSLNAEYVVIKNTWTTRKTLTGWTLRDASKHVYKFPTFRFGAGKSVKVHTGKGVNGLGNLHWRSSSYIWNNDGDTTTLKKKSGLLVDKVLIFGSRLVQDLLRGSHGEEHRPRAEDRERRRRSDPDRGCLECGKRRPRLSSGQARTKGRI